MSTVILISKISKREETRFQSEYTGIFIDSNNSLQKKELNPVEKNVIDIIRTNPTSGNAVL